jgi:hypothetical protein
MTRILLTLLFFVLMIGLLSSSPHHVFAQQGITPENWFEMRKMFRNKGPLPTIEEDVAALAVGDGKGAAIRLMDRGPDALPAVHAALDLEAPGRAALIRNEIRKAGWRIIDTDEEFNIVPSSK